MVLLERVRLLPKGRGTVDDHFQRVAEVGELRVRDVGEAGDHSALSNGDGAVDVDGRLALPSGTERVLGLERGPFKGASGASEAVVGDWDVGATAVEGGSMNATRRHGGNEGQEEGEGAGELHGGREDYEINVSEESE